MTTTKATLVLLVAIRVVTSSPSSRGEVKPKPHVILVVADDLGWNDVSWHNPKVLTPRLEELAKSGVLLEQSYVQPICTPTRSALLTGRYPFTIGRQRDVLWPEEPTGLTIKKQLLPQAMKAAGYTTHAVGKWHLGFCSWDYTPTRRGFDTFWGYYTGAEDYYHHNRRSFFEEVDPVCNDIIKSQDIDDCDTAPGFGYDFRNNTATDYSVDGHYSTFVFSSYIENLLESRSPSQPMFLYLPFQSVHTPLQVPDNYTKPFAHIKHQSRKIKLGMVLAMDEAFGRVVDALKTTGHYNNSIIVFTTDNGGPTVSAGNNWPLRGNKTTLWEGGTRGAAFVHSPLLPSKGIVSHKLIHVTDWFATIVRLGGGVVSRDTDGFDQWEAITTTAPSPRTDMVYNIDFKDQLNAGIRMGNYKLLVGDPGPGEWTPAPEDNPVGSQDFHPPHDVPFSLLDPRRRSPEVEEFSLFDMKVNGRSGDLNTRTFVAETDAGNGDEHEAQKADSFASMERDNDATFGNDVGNMRIEDAKQRSDQLLTYENHQDKSRRFFDAENYVTVRDYEAENYVETGKYFQVGDDVATGRDFEADDNATVRNFEDENDVVTVKYEVEEDKVTMKDFKAENDAVTMKDFEGEDAVVAVKEFETEDGVVTVKDFVAEDAVVTVKEFETEDDVITVNDFVTEDTVVTVKEFETEYDVITVKDFVTEGAVVTVKEFETESDVVTVKDLGLDPKQYMFLGQILSNDTTIRLYNIIKDPEERTNIASKKVDVVKILLNLIHHKMKDYVDPDILPNDPAANPEHWNDTWSPGWCHAK